MNDYEIGLQSGVLEQKEYGWDPKSRRWAGENYGWQSQESYNKLYVEGKLNPAQQQIERITSSVTQAVMSSPVIGPAFKALGGGINLAFSALPQPVQQTVAKGVELQQTAAENIAAATGLPVSLTDPLTIADVGTAGASAVASKGVRQAVTGAVKGAAKDIMTPPSPPLQPAMAVAGAVAEPVVQGAGQDLGSMISQPLKIASDLKRGSAWQNTVRTLQKGDNTRQIRDFLLRGPGGKIKGKNLLVTADELAANKEGIMDKLLERADAVAKAWDRYQRGGSAKAQRNLYDIASKNIFDSAELIYGKEGPRSYLARVSNWLTNDEWHHVFGNKEAGEFILMQAAQDPLVAANIFKRMENLGLNSSGVAQNIALMKSKRHTNWHDFMKAEGFEPKSPGKPLTTAGSTAPGDFADLSKALGEEIAAGRGDVNDIFKMLDLYADYNRWVKSQLPKYGAEIISDLPEGVGKAMQIGGYKTKPGRPRKTR